MQVRDIWGELHHLFEGKPEHILEIDLTNLRAGSMAECIRLLLNRTRECSLQTIFKMTQQEVLFPSQESIVHHVLQEQVTITMWMSFPALPSLSAFIDYNNEISFGYVRGTWNAVAVMTFFDLMYELNQMSPYSQLVPSKHTFSEQERKQFNSVWQDYLHVSS